MVNLFTKHLYSTYSQGKGVVMTVPHVPSPFLLLHYFAVYFSNAVSLNCLAPIESLTM